MAAGDKTASRNLTFTDNAFSNFTIHSSLFWF